MTRADVRTRVRDYVHESTASIWSDAQLNRYYLEELRSLPRKNIYLEELWTTSTVVDQNDYTLPTGTHKVEFVERNEGTTARPLWTTISGCDFYAGALYLPFTPSTSESIRIHIKKKFTAVDDDSTSLDIPDDQSEILVLGTVIRAYKQLIGYLRNSVSWDTVTKPGDLSIPVITNYLREAKADYNNLVQLYSTSPRPRDIDLVG